MKLIWLAAWASTSIAVAQGQLPSVPPETSLGSGPHKAIMETREGLPTHTVYRPSDLKSVKGKLPVVAWGNGGCANNGSAFRPFLTEIASHGYLVVAIGPMRSERTEAPPRPPVAPTQPATPPRPPAGPPATKAVQLIDAVNWAIAENARRESPFFKRLDTRKIALMGQSCGGVQAIAASADPRVTATVAWNSGLLPQPSTIMENVSKEAIEKLHAPIAYINGDPSDIAHNNAKDDFNRIRKVPVLFAWRKGMGHGGTYREPNGGELGPIAVAYLDWRLKCRKSGESVFRGADCRLCRDTNWHIEKKGID